MLQAVIYPLFLCNEDICLLGEYEGIDKIENHLNEDFCDICVWYVDNKLSIQFGDDEAKFILFELICFQCALSLRSENIRTPYNFLIFSGGRERAHWGQMG